MSVLINGAARDWAQIRIAFLGRAVAGVTAISYEEEQEIEDNYGAGPEPVSRGFGNIKYGASITLYAEEVEALQSAAPGRNLRNIPEFIITVTYQKGPRIVTDTLLNVRFPKNMRSPKQGDKSLPVELPLRIAGIKWG